ncbi:asparagine synthase (glutamine-hydrolyzing) [Rhizobium sp. SSA_523]|uniref:asparagine synthase (glutamine-hydrolyzing) n=1 Tax=Rhizobium sp. SSA_523 TaxID=2952477 RepID=UPI002090391B|nr:asparagine synthase (glutamine-hydrolyzing) [Rhizobium sp. SSA_523]MCO5731713.1 asparagine synthase (glutamine-hydrolyzing) [Rhizobium sp. SSA_523]WKC22911.1 asparagine synthase (glutamine-hydrolyzing) [Rhizobium sp. SSA_523]
MCGFAGFCHADLPVMDREPLLHAMGRAIAHRGPDASGLWMDEHCGLSHVRLSVVGLEDGQQPMESGASQLVIAFNGEIFNYVELRDQLAASGRRFRTASDTEVILALYETYGEDCLQHLNGDFAFALYDRRARRLLLARDRMGVRPLFYMRRGRGLAFASEAKALLELPDYMPALDPIALDQIFTLWSPIPPRTLFKDISELEPGHFMVVTADRIEIKSYWQLDYPDAGDSPPVTEDAAVESVGALLGDAVRIRMRADVKVSAYLSGGLDSSLICALAAPLAPQGLHSFSVTFDSAEHDESRFQTLVAESLGTRHHSASCGPDAIAAVFEAVIAATELPILRTAPAPLYSLAGSVRDNGMKVVLTGEGADEIFGGYDIFREAKLRRFCARQPASLRRPLLFHRLYPYLPGLQNQSADYLAAFFGTRSDRLDDPLFSHRPRLRNTAGTKLFYSDALRAQLAGYDAAEELVEKLPDRFGKWDPLHQAQYLETRFLLPGYILSSQGDRIAMAHGVEGRFPYLDHRVVELASRLPPQLKVKGLTEKHVLREVARRHLPEVIKKRPKQPYRAPDSASFRGEPGQRLLETYLSGDAVRTAGLFSSPAVDKLMAKAARHPLAGFRDNAALVGMLSTQIWSARFLERRQASGAFLGSNAG